MIMNSEYVININSLALAYLGDSIYEVYIRKYLVDKGIAKVKDLQSESIKYVSASSQAKFFKQLVDNNILTNDEMSVALRARNHSSHRSKSTDILSYKHSTALEAVIGYLYLSNKKNRIDELINYILGGNYYGTLNR